MSYHLPLTPNRLCPFYGPLSRLTHGVVWCSCSCCYSVFVYLTADWRYLHHRGSSIGVSPAVWFGDPLLFASSVELGCCGNIIGLLLSNKLPSCYGEGFAKIMARFTPEAAGVANSARSRTATFLQSVNGVCNSVMGVKSCCTTLVEATLSVKLLQIILTVGDFSCFSSSSNDFVAGSSIYVSLCSFGIKISSFLASALIEISLPRRWMVWAQRGSRTAARSEPGILGSSVICL